MAVELEEIALFGLFRLNKQTIQIREEHFANITRLLPDLHPIPIDFQKIQRLGFLRHPNGIYYRVQGTTEFTLRQLKDARWEFILDNGKRIRTIHYIHQVQRLWFDLFDDHLFLPKNAVAGKSPKTKPSSGGFQTRH